MQEAEACTIARTLTQQGTAMMAHDLGGGRWVVRRFQSDDLTGIYETVQQMPKRYRDAVAAPLAAQAADAS